MKKNSRNIWFQSWSHSITEFKVVKAITFFALPLMIMFGFYIQFHGEISPGGGFQSGIVFAMSFIIHDAVMLMTAQDKTPPTFISSNVATVFSAAGVLIYSGTGLLCLLKGGAFLDYRVLQPSNLLAAQEHGLMAIEAGVATTVFGSITLIYNSLRQCFVEQGKVKS